MIIVIIIIVSPHKKFRLILLVGCHKLRDKILDVAAALHEDRLAARVPARHPVLPQLHELRHRPTIAQRQREVLHAQLRLLDADARCHLPPRNRHSLLAQLLVVQPRALDLRPSFRRER